MIVVQVTYNWSQTTDGGYAETAIVGEIFDSKYLRFLNGKTVKQITIDIDKQGEFATIEFEDGTNQKQRNINGYIQRPEGEPPGSSG